jgi:hypothetical protein
VKSGNQIACERVDVTAEIRQTLGVVGQYVAETGPAPSPGRVHPSAVARDDLPFFAGGRLKNQKFTKKSQKKARSYGGKPTRPNYYHQFFPSASAFGAGLPHETGTGRNFMASP